MSTSSALASAKRRRAAGANQPVSGSNQMPESELESEQKPKFTPIQLLQLHEIRIKKLEMLLNENPHDNVYDNNDNNNNNDNNSNSNSNNEYLEKSLANMKKMIESKTDLNRSYFEDLIDSKISNNEGGLSKNDINELIDSKIVNINDKMAALVNDLKELDTFKNMLIKNQSDIIDNNKMLNVVSMKINNLITHTIGDNSDDENNYDNSDENADENEVLDMAKIINLFKQMNGGEEMLEKFIDNNDNNDNDNNYINIEKEELDVLESVINIEKSDNETNEEARSCCANIEKISDDIIEKIDISDDDEESDIKLFKNISEKIKEEISLATSEHAGAKKVAEATNDTHEILEEEAHAVV